MGTLKHTTPSTSALVGAYKDKIVVYLEGKTDLNLFANYWFRSKLDRIEFRQAGGCKGVLDGVKEYRRDGKLAFGLIDRDKLQDDQKWELVWEANDQEFLKSRPYDDYIRVTLKWEIENYLIHNTVVEQYIAHSDGGRLPRSSEDCNEYLLLHAQALIPHAAYNTALKQSVGGQWGEIANHTSKSRMEIEAVLDQMRSTGGISDTTWDSFRINLQKMDDFTHGDSASEELTGLLRRIDGKAFMHRIKKSHNIQHDITFHLADAISRMNAVSPELIGYVDEFYKA